MRLRTTFLQLVFAFCFLLFSSRLVGQQTVGLFLNDATATEGYTLFASLGSTKTYLIDNCGRKVNEWASGYTVGNVAHLLPNGSLLHACRIVNADFAVGGLGGRVELLDWAGNVTWHYTVSNATEAHHHDAVALPNGNVLMIVWEAKDSSEAVAQGRNPATTGAELWPDKIIEVQPTTPGNGNIVWEWHAWEHLVQEFDSTKANFGVVADHPERININYYDPTSEVNWLHCNGLAYNADLDQIALSSHRLDEIWLIDHSTTTQQAAGSTGGTRGKGGDLLYRYGNPQTYNRGTVADQKFYGQHNIEWVPAGDMYAGMLKVFNNGNGRPAGAYSTLEIFQPPMDIAGNYIIAPGQAFGPTAPVWTYEDNPSFYSQIISGLQRLPGNHTLVCEGTSGHFFEIDSSGATIWDYVNPVQAAGPLTQGDSVFGNSTFRAVRYLPDYPGLAGQDLTPGDRIEGNPLPLTGLCLGAARPDEAVAASFELFPNPFSSQFTLRRSKADAATLHIIDLNGRVLQTQRIVGKEVTVATDDLPAGFYFVQLAGSSQTYKICKLGY